MKSWECWLPSHSGTSNMESVCIMYATTGRYHSFTRDIETIWFCWDRNDTNSSLYFRTKFHLPFSAPFLLENDYFQTLSLWVVESHFTKVSAFNIRKKTHSWFTYHKSFMSNTYYATMQSISLLSTRFFFFLQWENLSLANTRNNRGGMVESLFLLLQ